MQAPHARPGAVTTGPIRGSRKVYLSPPGHPGLRVPLRELGLDPDEYAQTSPGRVSVQFHEEAS